MNFLIFTLTVLTVIGAVMGYPQERLLPDGAPVPDDGNDREDSVAAASEHHSHDYDDADDSDMYMEPDGAETVEASRNPTQLSSPPSPSSTQINSETRVTSTTSNNQPIASSTNESGAANIDKSLEQESQNFFPSFAELFANHRLSFAEQQQQQRYRPNRFLGYFQRDRNAYQSAAAAAAAAATARNSEHPLLGSGNFGVIRGGTYYPEEKENEEYSVDESLYNPYYSTNVARSRSNYYRNPKPQPIRGGDFFANFRDFADITAPPKSSFSHLSVVYANRNGTKGRTTEPRNIIETLRMLEEQEEDNDYLIATTTTEIPIKKLSQGKRKLLKLKKYHEDKQRKSRMTVEPLLALS